jgi:hypothetical protein
MNQKTLAGDRRRRKLITTLWIFLLTVGVIVLIYREMTAILYILATLGITALLVVVALSDLDHGGRGTLQPSKADETAPTPPPF